MWIAPVWNGRLRQQLDSRMSSQPIVIYSAANVQQAHLLTVERSDHHVHSGRQLRRAERPAFLQHQIVEIL